MMLYLSIYKFNICLKAFRKLYKPSVYYWVYLGLYLSYDDSEKVLKFQWDSL